LPQANAMGRDARRGCKLGGCKPERQIRCDGTRRTDACVAVLVAVQGMENRTEALSGS
jgi:hypothetical protein